MNKKTIALILIAFFAAGFANAVDLEISGEIKTGLFWQKVDSDNPDENFNRASIHHNDDAGPNEGRFRMNMHLTTGNVGMRVRFEQTAWTGSAPIRWSYAFAYSNFLDEQLMVTLGMLGESPWSAGGPDIWQELDDQIGIRTEIMPNFIPGLNLGFVLNRWNQMMYFEDRETLGDILMESVFGIAYTNDYFHGRFSWRLDGDADVYNHQQEGMSMMYRLEARVVEMYVPNLSVYANGWWRGIGAVEDQQERRNFLYVDYTPEAFSTELRLGLDLVGSKSHLFHAGAGFYYNIFPFLDAGVFGRYIHNFGEASVLDTVALRIEPQVRLDFGNFYAALVYSYNNEYFQRTGQDPGMRTRQWLNLRTVITF